MEDPMQFYEIVWAAAASAVSGLFAVLLWMMRGRLADKDSTIADLKLARDTFQRELEECYERHHGTGTDPST